MPEIVDDKKIYHIIARLDKTEKTRLDQICQKHDISVSKFVRTAIRSALQRVDSVEQPTQTT